MKFSKILFFCFSFILVYTNAIGEDDNHQQQLSLLGTSESAAVNFDQPETPPSLIPPPPAINVKGYVLMDADSGAIIAEKNSKQRLEPASLTKLMTLYIAFQALKNGQIHPTEKTTVSTKAWKTGGSRMFLKEGSMVPINLLLRGIIVASGNDACVTLAQHLAGTEQTFAQMMNQTAQHLGMKNSHYIDSTGLPDPNHYSTAYDMAVLTRALIKDFPEYYHLFSEKWLVYNHIKQPNRNRLLWRDASVDGLKTGHTNAAGYCLIASAKRNGMRLIVVVMGAHTDKSRADYSEALLNYGFRFYQTQPLFEANKAITTKRVWFSTQKYLTFGLKSPLYVTTPIGEYKNIKAVIRLEQQLYAPIFKGQTYGNLIITLNNKPIIKAPLIALENDFRAGILSRTWDHIALFFGKIF